VLYTSAMLSGLFLAEMSLDRMLAVRFPMKAASLCSTTRAKITVILTTIVIVALNVHLMFALKYVRDPVLGKAFQITDDTQTEKKLKSNTLILTLILTLIRGIH
jgi:hypothetical protein